VENMGTQVIEGWYKESGLINEWIFATDIIYGPITLWANWVYTDRDVAISVTFAGIGEDRGMSLALEEDSVSIAEIKGGLFSFSIDTDSITLPSGYVIDEIRWRLSNGGVTPDRVVIDDTLDLTNADILAEDGLSGYLATGPNTIFVEIDIDEDGELVTYNTELTITVTP